MDGACGWLSCFGKGKKKHVEQDAATAIADAEREAANGRLDSETARAAAREEGSPEEPAPLLSHSQSAAHEESAAPEERKSLDAPPQKPLSSKAAVRLLTLAHAHALP